MNEQEARLRALIDVGPGLLIGLSLLTTAQALAPIALIVAFSGVVSSLTEDRSALLSAVLFLITFLAAQRLLELLSEPIQLWAARRVDVYLRVTVGRALSCSTDLGTVESADVRALSALVAANNAGNTPGTAVTGLFGLVGRFAAVAGCVWLIAQHSPVAAGVAIVLLLLRRRLQAGSFSHVYASWALAGEPTRRFEYWKRFLSGIEASREIRVFGLADWALARFGEAAMARFEPVWGGRRTATKTSWAPFIVGIVGASAVFAVVAIDPRVEAIDAATMIAAGLTAFRMSEPSAETLAIENARPAWRAALELISRVDTGQTRDATASIAVSRTRDLPSAPPEIRWSGISFSYADDRRPALVEVDLVAPSGGLLAIVGQNGAGKSTLLSILALLRHPTTGGVLADGRALAASDVVAWRRRIAILPQNFVKFNLTLRENVMLGAAELRHNHDLFDRLAPTLGLDDLVATLPRGWDTMLGEGVTEFGDLSGGQWQRVGLARARYAIGAGRDVLVLDEPTAHLDARAEAAATESILALREQATTVLVSHRLATVRNADQIAVMDSGRVVEEGDHDRLIAKNGLYARMYEAQAERYRDGASTVTAGGES